MIMVTNILLTIACALLAYWAHEQRKLSRKSLMEMYELGVKHGRQQQALEDCK